MALDYKRNWRNYQQYYLRVKKIYAQPTTKASLALILSLLTVSFFGIFAIKPTLKTIAKLKKEVDVQKEIKDKLAKKINDLQTAEINFSSIQKDIIYLDRSLPQQAEFLRFAKQINYLTYTNNLKIVQASFGKFSLINEEVKSQTNPIDFDFKLTGDYEGMESFLSGLEQIDRFTILDSMNISSKKGKEGILLELKGQIFWHPKEESK